MLDNVTEARIVHELERRAHKYGEPVVVVVHRILTLSRADQVIVMDEGTIVQHITFTELERYEVPFQDLLEARATSAVVSESG